MSKWLYKKIHAMTTTNVLGEAYIKRDDVLALVSRTCGNCKYFVEGKKKTMSKCINPTHHSFDGWRWTTPSGNACQKWEGKE